MIFDAAHGGFIPWERRKSLGYFRSFFRTLALATFMPTRLARATGEPIDLRSARLFRWIVRALVIVPCVALFVFAILRNGGLGVLINISVTEQQWVERFWEPRFLWTVGATLWPVLPIGFAISIILATGISHWFFMKRLEPVRRNRAMVFSFYLCAPLGWVWIPCAACAAVVALPPLPETSQAVGDLGMLCVLACELSVVVLLLAMVNSVRAVDAATQCGVLRSLIVGAGVIMQAAVSFAIGLALFPAIVGLFRLMVISLWR